jgi:hypothetical protein
MAVFVERFCSGHYRNGNACFAVFIIFQRIFYFMLLMKKESQREGSHFRNDTKESRSLT